jgi:predicted acetyltransferase
MIKIILRNLVLSDRDQFVAILNEDWEENFIFAHYWKSLANKDFEKFIKMVPEFSTGQHIPKEHVPCTFLFAFNIEGEMVGRTSIRHFLTEDLLKNGGHIGYGVAPKYRQKGYATSILNESLNYVRTHLPDIKKVLLTCDEGNVGSQKTIENNNGVLENIVKSGEISKMILD